MIDQKMKALIETNERTFIDLAWGRVDVESNFSEEYILSGKVEEVWYCKVRNAWTDYHNNVMMKL